MKSLRNKGLAHGQDYAEGAGARAVSIGLNRAAGRATAVGFGTFGLKPDARDASTRDTSTGDTMLPGWKNQTVIATGVKSSASGLADSGTGRVGRAILGGLTGWVLAKVRREGRPRPQLAILERITLAPRQSLALIEASGQRLLVATSADGTPAFYPVGFPNRQTPVDSRGPRRATSAGRVSW
jgi:hypothetical protein